MRYLALFVFIFSSTIILAQDVTAFHDVKASEEANTYTIKTSISGLQGVDIARITYFIDDAHTYKASPNNSLFSDRNEKYVKFYVMAVPASGELNIELGVTLSGAGEFIFPVEFQYSKNEEKKSINFPRISISGGGAELAVVEETSIAEPVMEKVETPEPVTNETEENLDEKIKAEEAKRLAEEKALAEKTTKEEEANRVAEEQKVAAEKKALAEKVAKEEEAKRLAEEQKAAATKKAAEEKALAEKMDAEKAAKEEEAKLVAENAKVEEEPLETVIEETVIQPEAVAKSTPTPSPTPTTSTSSSTKYSIQILSLAEFSQTRLNTYIKQHNLDASKIKKSQVDSWTKISYGELSSKDEAREMIQKLRRNHNITDAFLVTLP